MSDEITDLRVAIMRLSRRLRNEATTGLTPSQTAVLGSLRRCGEQTPSQIAEHERISAPSVTRIIASLVEAGYVERHPDPTDGRRVNVRLTPRAEAEIDDVLTRRNQWLRTQLADLPAAERQTVLAAASIMDRLARR